MAVLGFVILAWRNPFWLVDRQTDARLRLHGVHSRYVKVDGYSCITWWEALAGHCCWSTDWAAVGRIGPT